MKYIQFRKSVLLFCLIVLVSFNLSFAQHFVKMTDRQWIELALDMIRKGVQQQDTTKILMVVAPEVSVKGEKMESNGIFSRRLQTIFNSSYKRDNQIKKPYFPRADNPLHLSNFWDFDILDPQIKIDGDSAIVDCELVLWGAPAEKGINQTSKRIKERFVFNSPPKIEPPPSGDYHKWPPSSTGKSQTMSIRSWQLIGFEKLMDFLNENIEGSRNQNREEEGK